jgi:hypothetical protein
VRTAGKALLAVAVSVLASFSLGGIGANAQTPAGGITVTPAALVLNIAKGSDAAAVTFTISNTYAADVTLHFALEKAGEPGVPDTARAHMAFAADDVVIPANGKIDQTLRVQDAPAIAPGSQTATMVLSYGGNGGQGIGVLPSMRLPVTVIKQDGAVTSLGLTNIAGPSIAMTMPSAATVTIRNTGNMVAIPRGTVNVMTPSGRVLAHGVLNEASRAVSPGSDIKLTAALMQTAAAWAPGPYKLQVTYGLGGDAASTAGTAQFLFIAWWHPLLVVLLGAAWYGIIHRPGIRLSWHKKQRGRPGPPKRQGLIGRNIS